MKGTDLVALSRAELGDLLAAGHPIDPAALAGADYQGISLGLPRLVDRVSWKKFFKAFRADGDRLAGFNLRAVDDGLDRPWRPRLRQGAPIRFGHFEVVPLDQARPAPPRSCGPGLLLDYRRGRPAGLLAALRDPLVALEPGRVELLLGWSYLAVGRIGIPTPSFFVLERSRRPALG